MVGPVPPALLDYTEQAQQIQVGLEVKAIDPFKQDRPTFSGLVTVWPFIVLMHFVTLSTVFKQGGEAGCPWRGQRDASNVYF